jgi:dUTP pyrophosphatase
MKVKVKKLNPDAVIPKYATAGAACFDLQTINPSENVHMTDSQLFHTGLSFEIPEGYVMMVYSRSGHGYKNGVRLSNCVGVIDSDYRGEVMVKLHNDGNTHMPISKGDRVAQAMIIPVHTFELEEAEELSETERGTGGFGSTGK